MWISPNGGDTWTQARFTPGTDSTYQVVATNPRLSDSPTEKATIRAAAVDTAGNSVERTIYEAYVLR